MNDAFWNIQCSVHHGKAENYLVLDRKTFQINCMFCAEEGVKPLKKNLTYVEPDDEELNARHCYKHETEDALFYCDDCTEFLCKACFATEHRQHSCSTFDWIVESIRNKFLELSKNWNSLKEMIESNNDDVKNMNEFYIKEKKEFKTTLDTINTKIDKALKDKAGDFSNEIESFFNGVDQEVEMSVRKLDNTRKKVNNMWEEFTKMKNEVDEIKSDNKICLYKKDKDEAIAEHQNFWHDIELFFKENLSKTKQKVVDEEGNFAMKCEKFTKALTSYESSVINTIVSGIPNICMRIRRFRRYTNLKSKYFKTASICMLTSNSVNLTGFALCGLINEHNSPASSYKVGLKIYEWDNVQQYKPTNAPLASIEVDVPVITNMVDPVFQFYLKNSVTISKNKLYFIILNNLSSLTFINTWTGAVGKEVDDHLNQNSVICNNSNVKFNFWSAFGVESDFNEFSEGILSDVIFSQID